MPEWQALRNKHPELFEGPNAFEVYAQDSAVVDNSIAGWQLEALSEHYPGGIFAAVHARFVQIRILSGIDDGTALA